MAQKSIRFLTLASAGLTLLACKGSPAEPGPSPAPVFEEDTTASVTLDLRASINDACPRSGKAVAADSLTTYRAYVIGFCNTHCRDDFTGHVGERPHDTDFFDAIIARIEESKD